MNSPKIFAGSSNLPLTERVSSESKIPLGRIDLGVFSDTELDIWVEDDVNNSNVFILQSNSAPVNDNIIQLALISDALRRSGAHKITAIIPYFGYSRKEKQTRRGEPISAKVVADLIITSGINKVICLDLHADAIVGFFDVPVIYLSALEILADALKKGKNVALTGFGTFKTSKRAARQGVNPATGVKIQIPATTVPKFSAGKGLKEAVKK